MDRLANISIYSSTVKTPDTSSAVSPDWTFRNHQDEAYGEIGEIKFDSPIEMQHVAVLGGSVEDLSLAEVEVYGKG